MNACELLSQLPESSLIVTTEKSMVRIDGALPEVEQTYLTIRGTPAALKWFASLMTQMANSAERHSTSCSAIVSPMDLDQIKLSDWSAIDLVCDPETSAQDLDDSARRLD